MVDLTDKQQLINYLQSHGLYTKHGLGQNFLVDKEVLDKIIDAAEVASSDLVIEVGPGLGVLTQELMKKADKVVAVELDKKLAEVLSKSFSTVISNPAFRQAGGSEKSHDRLEIINSDILKVNIEEITKGFAKYKVVANIPYYITSKIIKQFLTTSKKPELIVMLVQKEVAERICAKKGDMSVLALSVQAYGDPSTVSIVKADSFFPAPEVDSAILKIENIGYKKPEVSEKALFRAIKTGFTSKRKTLLNNFSAGLRLNKEAAGDIIKSAGINPGARAQDLGLEDWVKLAQRIRSSE